MIGEDVVCKHREGYYNKLVKYYSELLSQKAIYVKKRRFRKEPPFCYLFIPNFTINASCKI